MKNVMSNEQRAAEMYRVAYRCSQASSTSSCTRECVNCPLNVSLYDEDPREAMLIKMSAQMDHERMTNYNEHQRRVNNTGVILTMFVIVGIILMIWGCVV